MARRALRTVGPLLGWAAARVDDAAATPRCCHSRRPLLRPGESLRWSLQWLTPKLTRLSCHWVQSV